GFLFIPLITDILLRLGIDKSHLLSENYVTKMEKVLDGAAREEFGMMEKGEHIANCIKMQHEAIADQEWVNEIVKHFSGGGDLPHQQPFAALQRADTFLFSMFFLPVDKKTGNAIFKYWFAMISFFLTLDDVEDFESDQQTGEMNVVIEAGTERVHQLLQDSITTIAEINPAMSAYMTTLLQKLGITSKLNTITVSR
ncbi:MAG TPA: hypothetical protein VIK74_06665, partial [Parasegetibacter sp.]